MQKLLVLAALTFVSTRWAAASDAGVPCPAANPLGGHVELRFRHSPEDYARDARLQGWFVLTPADNLPGISPYARLWAASDMVWRTSSSNCVDVPGPDDEICRCAPSRAAGRAFLDEGSTTFHPLERELEVELPDEVRNSLNVDLECVKPRGGGKSKGRTGLSLNYKYRVVSRPEDVHDAFTVLVEPSGCLDENNRMTDDCRRQLRRYAAIPFEGSGDLKEELLHTTMRWEICCGCGKPAEGDLKGEDDPCGDSSIQRGLLENAVQLASKLRNELRPRVERYEDQRQRAEAYRSDFELVSNSCAGWDISMELLKALIGGAGAPEGLASAGAQAFVQLFEIIEKVLDEDPSVILSGAEHVEIDLLGVEGFTLGSLWDAASDIYTAAGDIKEANSVPAMKRRLEDCAGVPLVSDLVYDDARKYLEHLEAALQELPAIHQLTTRIQQADTDLFNKWHNYYRACVEEKLCRGTDPEDCNPPPQ